MDQVFYKLTELASLLGVETSVLRFWEKEFKEALKPLKAGPRKKLYRPQDLEVFKEIKRLLQDERYTIAGARQKLLSKAAPPPAESELEALRSVLAETKKDLQALRRLLLPAGGRSGQKP